MCQKSLKELIQLVQNNHLFANNLLELIQNSKTVEENLSMITPSIDFEGFSKGQVSETLHNFEVIRKLLRSSQNAIR